MFGCPPWAVHPRGGGGYPTGISHPGILDKPTLQSQRVLGFWGDIPTILGGHSWLGCDAQAPGKAIPSLSHLSPAKVGC